MKRSLLVKGVILAIFMFSIHLLQAQYIVDFEGEGEEKPSYASGNVFLTGVEWNMTDALIGTLDNDWKNGLRSARLRGYAGSSMTMLEDKQNGVGSISFYYRRYGTDSQVDWKVEYSTDAGNNWTQVGASFTAPASDDVQLFDEIVNAQGDVRIRIKRATEDGSANRRLNIDDLTLTDYSGGGNIPPTIANITQTPSFDITSTTTVAVAAEITDPDGNITLAQLKWGTTSGDYPNTIAMSVSGGSLYSTTTDIPAQTNGTTVFYVVYAEDNDGGNRTSSQQSYLVRDPAVTTLPYSEDFENDLGDSYTFSLSGNTKYWLHSSSGYAYMNGFNTGELEDDWLILPGFNKDIYNNVVLSFETWKRFGFEDDDNYFKLLYSTDYEGMGSPSLANWTELAFNQPVDEQVWESSGNIDLNGLQGELVYIAFRYHYNTGAYRLWQVDNISITGDFNSGNLPVKLAITNINGNINPTVNNPFSLTIESQDENNNPAQVNTNTTVQLSMSNGSGILGGTLSKTIANGSSSVTFDNLTYNIAENGITISAATTAGMSLTPAVSSPINVLAVATQLAFNNFPTSGQANLPVGAFEVQAQRPDGTIDEGYSGSVSISKASGSGSLSGTLTKSFANGVASFDDLVFDASGNYTLLAQSTGLTSATSTVITIAAQPEIADEIVPQYIQGINGTNATRLPFAFWVNISNLLPNTTYRYINQVVTENDTPTTNGAGNVIYPNQNGNFYRTSSPSFSVDGAYGTFTSNVNGQYSGWFMTEATGNARFTPGNEVFFRIRINDGNEGTTAINYLTTSTAAVVINFGNEPNDVQGTGIRATSASEAKNFVMLYDNANGSGRPVYATSIETTGVDYNASTSWAEFYRNEVASVDGSWGGIVPNVNAAGVLRIEERSLVDGSIVEIYSSENGIWGTTDTRNPNGGIDNILVLNLNLTNNPLLTVSPSVLNGFTYVEGSGPSQVLTYSISGEYLSGSGNINVSAPDDYEVSTDGTTFSQSLNLPYANGSINGQPVLISVRLKAGLNVGLYNSQTIVNSGGGATEKNVTLNGEVTSLIVPEIVAELVPQFIQGVNGSNNSRLPFAFRAHITGLQAGATYRYINQVVTASDGPSTNGAGNVIYVTFDGVFVRTSNPSFSEPGAYGEFTADASGNYSGWFMTEPTGNARFTPGNEVFFRIRINDGNEGTNTAHWLTTSSFAKVINFGTTASVNEGTGIRASSADQPTSIAMLFDNSVGENRPIYASSVEPTGVDYATAGTYAGFYVDHVFGNSGAWGGIIPNINSNGIRNITLVNPITGFEKIYQSTDGVWGDVDTRNPSGGIDNVIYLDLILIGNTENNLDDTRITYYNNTLKIENSRNEVLLFEIYNVMGQRLLIKQIPSNSTQIIQNQLIDGGYIVRLHNGVKHSTKKFIIK